MYKFDKYSLCYKYQMFDKFNYKSNNYAQFKEIGLKIINITKIN